MQRLFYSVVIVCFCSDRVSAQNAGEMFVWFEAKTGQTELRRIDTSTLPVVSLEIRGPGVPVGGPNSAGGDFQAGDDIALWSWGIGEWPTGTLNLGEVVPGVTANQPYFGGAGGTHTDYMASVGLSFAGPTVLEPIPLRMRFLPEPGSMALATIGVLALVAFRRPWRRFL